MILKQLKNAISAALLITTLNATDLAPVVDGIPQDYSLAEYNQEFFDEWYERTGAKANDFRWLGLVQNAILEGHRNVLHFLLTREELTREDCKLTGELVWDEVKKWASDQPNLLSFMLTAPIPERYKITREMIYLDKNNFSLSVQNIKDINLSKALQPETREQSKSLYSRVFVLNRDMKQVEALFAALPDLLPLLDRQAYEDTYSQAIDGCSGSYKERTALREAFLAKLPKTQAELDEERREAEVKAERNRAWWAERSRQAALEEQNRLDLWRRPADLPPVLTLTNETAADVWQAFYGVYTVPVGCFQAFYGGATFSENDIVTISNGAVIQFANKDGQTVQGRLVGVSGSKTTYTKVGEGTYGPRYNPSVVSISVWEELRATMQANQPKKGSMSASQDEKNPRMINLIYSFGEKPAECYLYKLFLDVEG